VPRIGGADALFGVTLDEADGKELVTLGKLTVQAKNCMNCHTLLGNGAYYAPDLTKAWLDRGWVAEEVREQLMVEFLMDPEKNARTFGTGRHMPRLGITDAEARGVIAFLKWMASIDTNGFPSGVSDAAHRARRAPVARPQCERRGRGAGARSARRNGVPAAKTRPIRNAGAGLSQS
jgi:mono/diheme cytochrome c family protein